MDTATKTGTDAAKTVEAIGDLTGNKIADKITSVGKTKNKRKVIKHMKQKKFTYHRKKFITKKWVEVYDQSGNADNRYKPSKQIRIKTSMLQSDLCDYSDAYVAIKRTVTVPDPNNAVYDKKVAIKYNPPFISCISKMNNTLMDNAEDLDIVMPMYNFTEYSKNYSKTSESLWNNYRDEPNSGVVGNINYFIKDSKSFDYKISITEKSENNNTEKEVEIAIPLKYFNTFWRALDRPLINCKVSLTLTQSKNCVITS